MTEKVKFKNLPKATYCDGVWTGFKVNHSAGHFQLGERFVNQLKENSEIIGQIDGKTGNSETFGSIYDKSVRCALWLRKNGIGRNDVVAYCSGNHMDTCIPLLSTFYVGSIFNPWWNGCLDEDVSKFFIQHTQPKVLFIDEESAEIVLKALKDIDYELKIIVFGKIPGLESFADILDQANADELQSFECTKIHNEKEPAVIMYTSGTTSNPKGALHTYGSMTSMVGPTKNEGNISLWFANLCWLSAVISTVRGILTQSTAIIIDSPNEEMACKLIDQFKVTTVSMGTAVANRLSKTKEVDKYDISSVNSLFFAGSVAKKEVVEFLITKFENATIVTGYGSTECMGSVGLINPKKLTSSGRVTPNHEIKVIDVETNETLGPNKQGELYCRGTTQMKCYWNDAKATSEAIDSDGWYHTGDVGYYDDDGDFFIIERIKELIKYRLHHVPPAAIESVIHDIPGVAEVAVVAKPHMEDLEQPTAFITKIPGVEVTENDVHKAVKDKLHDRMKLRGGVYFLDAMPHTASGKISKRELRALTRAQAKW